MKVSENNISTFHPFDFKKQFIEFDIQQKALKENLTEFFIHALSDKNIKVRLPLPPHRKTVNDFFIVTQGYAKRKFGINTYCISENELINIPKMQVSTTDYYSENINGFYCHFSDEFLANNSLLLNWKIINYHNAKIKLNNKTAIRIIKLLQTIEELYWNNWNINKKLIGQYLRTVITEINLTNNLKSHEASNKKNEITTRYIKLINDNLNKKYPIRKLSSMLHITPNHLNKVIKSQLGKSAQSVYNEIILQESKVLLLQTSKDINEIAFDLGFNDPSYFGKFFKKHTQQSPLEYRKMIEIYQNQP